MFVFCWSKNWLLYLGLCFRTIEQSLWRCLERHRGFKSFLNTFSKSAVGCSCFVASRFVLFLHFSFYRCTSFYPDLILSLTEVLGFLSGIVWMPQQENPQSARISPFLRFQLSFQDSHSVPVVPVTFHVISNVGGMWRRWRCRTPLPGKVGKSNRVAGPKSGISLRNEAPPPEICGAAYRAKSGGSYFQRLKQSEKGSRGDGAADACLHMRVEKCWKHLFLSRFGIQWDGWGTSFVEPATHPSHSPSF